MNQADFCPEDMLYIFSHLGIINNWRGMHYGLGFTNFTICARDSAPDDGYFFTCEDCVFLGQLEVVYGEGCNGLRLAVY